MTSQQTLLNVQVGDISVQVVRAGQGDPLLYFHGAFGYAGWPTFLEKLTNSFTVYAPIQPGFSENNGIESLDDLLDLTLYHFDLIDALGLDKPNIVGHFVGGMIAAEMAAIRPNEVGKLVLAAPAGMWLDDDPGIDYFATPSTDLPGVLFSNPESDLAKSLLDDGDTDEEKALSRIERVRSLSAVGKYLWPIPDKGLKKRLARVKSSTLVIVGDADQVVPASHGKEIVDRLQDGSLEVLSGAGHMFPFERPDDFSKSVTNFLGD